ncbi:reticulon-like protein B16 isoform X1 [Amborella trichopoda]|uniref:reticulon-like protein B16 isoform X1 n=1 Tax=Amborella trichopoda TaxID=13333 RepID=UPI0009BF2C93|nr:reticulon-like protein B16 isoform X1 [Amborella trichopoda]XP_020521714.1 reticulon-like protein B16 isoform X1 [Amborella trichopoda]|eukprot:XP_020521713.1 reticulon-like protein B16 isoform X1 [Amborella trichopoda]
MGSTIFRKVHRAMVGSRSFVHGIEYLINGSKILKQINWFQTRSQSWNAGAGFQNGSASTADVILWKQRRVTLAIIVGATIAWLLFEHSGVSFLSISSDVLLLLIVILFVRANCAVLWNKQLQPLPELVLSEEMVNNSAASFRVKLNYMLLMAHDIILGRDFKLFFKIVVCLWLVSIIGGFLSFFTLMYVGIIMSITLTALYNKYEERVDRCAGIVHSQLSKQYSRVDANVLSKLPHGFSKDKDR